MGCTMATHDPIVLLFVQEKADFAYRVQWYNVLAQNTKLYKTGVRPLFAIYQKVV